MKTWQILLAGVLMGLLAAGLVLLIASPIKGTPIRLSPPPTPTHTTIPQPTKTPQPILVQIGGEVFLPGLFELEEAARLDDLIDLAGGLTGSADKVRINLAAICRDGDYFYIPAEDEPIPETARNAPQNTNLGTTTEFIYPLDLNQATQAELESLPGIGPDKAEAILAHREAQGSFGSLEDLLEVKGIGPKTLETLKEYLTIEP